jgi:predicted nucleotidyltransferase
MSPDILGKIFDALNRHGVRYALFGGLAVGAHGLARTTKDVDLFLASSPGNVEAAVAALRELFDDPDLAEITPSEMEKYGLIRYGLPQHDFVIDLTTRLGEAVRFEDLEIESIDFLGVSVPVVSARTLIRLKVAAGRPQDLADVLRLRERYGLDERGD